MVSSGVRTARPMAGMGSKTKEKVKAAQATRAAAKEQAKASAVRTPRTGQPYP